jgi:protein SCO1/2
VKPNVTLVCLGYTHFPDLCPQNHEYRRIGDQGDAPLDRDQAKMVSVTTDPARDTPGVPQTWLRHVSPAFTALVVTLGNPVISHCLAEAAS